MTQLVLRDMRNDYVNLISWLMTDGDICKSRLGDMHEVTGVSICLPEPIGVMLPIGVERGINTRLAAVETLQILSGTFDAELIQRASPQYAGTLVTPNDPAYGAYGLRVRYQLESLYHELRRVPDTRRAVLSIWREDDLIHDGDRPCTLSLQFLIRNDKLEMHVTMRSQDAWLGVPYDFFMFNQLQRSLASALSVGVGKYVHHVGSLHLYLHDVPVAERLRKIVLPSGGRPDVVLDQFPNGVQVIHEGDLFLDVAERLLDGSFTDDEAFANDWYIGQLAQIDGQEISV